MNDDCLQKTENVTRFFWFLGFQVNLFEIKIESMLSFLQFELKLPSIVQKSPMIDNECTLLPIPFDPILYQSWKDL